MTERSGKFTKGPYEVLPSHDAEYVLKTPLQRIAAITGKYNAALIHTSFNAATTAEDMGYDGQAAMEALPKLLEVLVAVMAMAMMEDEGRIPMLEARALLAACRAKEPTS